MSPRVKFHIWLTVITVVFAALAGAFRDEPSAYAQEDDNDYVDVGLILEIPNSRIHQVKIIVVNNGLRPAYDVEVVVDVVYPTLSYFEPDTLLEPPIGMARLDGRDDLRWTIPVLGGLQRAEFTPVVRNFVTPDSTSRRPGGQPFDNQIHPHEFFGKVTTASFESDLHGENNTFRVWSYNAGYSNTEHGQAGGNYTVEVIVDEPHPSPGDTVDFTISADRPSAHSGLGFPTPPIDLKVDIELTDGLSVAGTPTYLFDTYYTYDTGGQITFGKAPVPDSFHYSDGVFNIGTLRSAHYQKNPRRTSVKSTVTLPVRVSNDAVVNEQCVTAKLTGNPPPGTGRIDDDISDNMAMLCLGDQTVEPFVSGQVDAFTVYPCVGITDDPCDSADDIRVRAAFAEFGDPHPLNSGTAVFQVDPLRARIYDGHTNLANVLQSVNNGDTVSWQTAVSAGRPYTSGLASGVELYYSRAPYMGTSGWGGLTMGIAARDVAGNTPPPGKVFLRSTSTGNEFRKAESPNYEELRTAPTGSSTPTTKINYFLEFEKLGTYKFTWHAVAKRSTLHGSENCSPTNGVNQVFCASETYTFHVGPIADLEVKATPASGAMTAGDQVALTVTATNHGPEIRAPDVRVPVALPSGMRFVRADSDDYDEQTGVWNIGELKSKGFRHSLRQTEGATLTIVAALTGDVTEPVAGSIKNHQDYCVRIGAQDDVDLPCDGSAVPAGYTQHSAPYYDHRPDNNRFSLSADWRALADQNIAPYVIGAGLTSSPAAGDAYQLGEIITLDIIFNEAVRVQGTPMLALEIGGSTRQVSMASHSGDTLTFLYTVGAGDTDTDGVSVPQNGLTLPDGATITNLSRRTDAVLQFLGFGNQAGHKVNAPVTTPDPTPPYYIEVPDAPSALAATPGDREVALQWAPYCCDRKDIFYQLWRGDFPTWQNISRSDRDTAEHTVSGLTNGETYRFRVRAVYRHEADDGTFTEHPGAPSRTVVATPYAPVPNQAPNRPPVFLRPNNENFSVVERAPRGTHVATVRATDPDDDSLTYTLDGENAAQFGIANINGAGVITVAEAELDYTWEPGGVSFSIGVEVTDDRGGRDNRTVDVEVTPSELRNNSPVAEDPGTPSVACDAPENTEVATIIANDPEGDPLWYILVDGTDAFRFEGGGTDHPDPTWSNDHVVLVSNGSGATLEAARKLDGDICGKLVWVVVEIEEENNPSNNDTLVFQVRVRAEGAGSRSNGSDEGGSSALVAFRTWAGSVRNWWTAFWDWTDWDGQRLASRP